MPDATIIHLEEEFRHPDNFDLHVELSQGSVTQHQSADAAADGGEVVEPDLATKLQALEQTAFFANLERR